MIPRSSLKSGDIMFSRGDGLLSKGILMFQNWHTKQAKYSHVAGVLSEHNCIESLWSVKINALRKYEGQEIEIWRLRNHTDSERNMFRIMMQRRATQSYGITKILLFALDASATGIARWFGRKKPVWWFSDLGYFDTEVCSMFIAGGCELYMNHRFRNESGDYVSPHRITPDFLHDLIQLDGVADLIYKS